jgi:hypothetical protein
MALYDFAMNQIFPNVRKEMAERGTILDACLCFLGFSPDGEPAFAAVADVSTPSDFAKASKIAGLLRASKVIHVTDAWGTRLQNPARPSACPYRQQIILIDLVLPDGSYEWRLGQAYTRNGKQIAWEEPAMLGRGFQSFLPPWGSIGKPN